MQEVGFPPSSAVFSCKLFARPGKYKAALFVTHAVSSYVIAESNVMLAHWSSEYSVAVIGRQPLCTGQRFIFCFVI